MSSLRRHLSTCMILFAFVLLSAFTVPDVWAKAGLAPVNPSDLVHLEAMGTGDPQPPCPTASRLIDTRVLPDGTTTPFIIPAGFVLIITSADFHAEYLPDFNYEFNIFRPNGSSIIHANGKSDVNGRVFGEVKIPTGVAIKPGAALCAAAEFFTGRVGAFARIDGFLAKDK
jgi:hypothetical protein